MKLSRAKSTWANAAKNRAARAEFEARVFSNPTAVSYAEMFETLPSVCPDRIVFRTYSREAYDDLLEFADSAGSSEIGAEFTFPLAPIEGVETVWSIALYANYTDEAIQTLRAVGKMRTETQTYETLACN